MSDTERAEALDELRGMLPPGSTVCTVLRHVSKSGMSRAISPVVCVNGNPRDITYLVALAGVAKRSNKHEGLSVGGSGMDMGFHLIYSLSRSLYPNGHKCTGDSSCPSNDHNNDYNAWARRWREEHPDDTEGTPGRAFRAWWSAGETERYSTSRVHTDGGYAVSQRWL